MDTVAPMPAGADWQDHASTRESQMGATTTNNTSQDSTTTKKQRPPVMVLSGSYTTPVIVGRGSQATLNLGRINKQVSRRHAIVEWHSPASQFRITVLGQNGVRINGVGYPSGQQAPLKRGDVVDLVGVKMVFKTPSTPPPASVQTFSSTNNSHKALFAQGHDDEEQDENEHHLAFSPLSTPTKKPQYSHSGFPQSPVSSPARFSDPATGSPVAARMRQKMLKYESRSSDYSHQHLQSPPPSDPPTDLGYLSSPVKSRPLFDVAREPEETPTVYQHHPHHLHRTDDNVFLTTPTKAAAPPTISRTPLTTLQIDAPSTNNNTNHVPAALRSENIVVRKPAHVEDKKEEKQEEDEPKLKTIKPVKSVEKKENTEATIIKNEEQQEAKSTPFTEKADRKAPLAQKVDDQTVAKKKKQKELSTSTQKSSTRPSETDSAKSENNKTKTKASKEVDEAKSIKSKQHKKQHDDGHGEGEDETLVKTESKKKTKKVLADEADTQADNESPSGSTKPKTDYTEMIIDTLVFARKKKSMTLSELYDEIMVSQPSLVKSQDPVVFKEELLRCLSGAKCVGKIVRKGKDAYNKPLESQWYYIPEMDHNVMRKLTRQEVMPSARKCTLKDKQYFFKMPPKLPYHRKSTSPYAVKPSRTKDVRLELTDDADADNRSSSSGSSSESDSEGEPLALLKKANLEKRKRAEAASKEDERRTTNTSTKQSKKRKMGDERVEPSRSKLQQQEGESEEQDEESSEEEDEADQDSLDDLSELSGLEDHDN